MSRFNHARVCVAATGRSPSSLRSTSWGTSVTVLTLFFWPVHRYAIPWRPAHGLEMLPSPQDTNPKVVLSVIFPWESQHPSSGLVVPSRSLGFRASCPPRPATSSRSSSPPAAPKPLRQLPLGGNGVFQQRRLLHLPCHAADRATALSAASLTLLSHGHPPAPGPLRPPGLAAVLSFRDLLGAMDLSLLAARLQHVLQLDAPVLPRGPAPSPQARMGFAIVRRGAFFHHWFPDIFF